MTYAVKNKSNLSGSEGIIADPGATFGAEVGIFTTQLRDGVGLQQLAPLTGTSASVNDNVSHVVMNPEAEIVAFTMTLPTARYDGQRVRFFSTQAIDTFGVNAASGQNISGGNYSAALAQFGVVEFIWQASTAVWQRSN